MSKMVSSLSDALEKIYQSFVLRDLLGFVLPGSLSLISLWYLFQNQCQHPVRGFQCLKESVVEIANVIPTLNVTQVLAFLGASYLTAWLFQSVHYGLVDWIFQIVSLLVPHRKEICRIGSVDKLLVILRALFWPVAGILYYMGRSAKLNRGSGATWVTPPSIKESPSLITRGALAPDEAYMKIRTTEYPPGARESFSRYPERLSVLMVMTGNFAIASVLLLIAFKLSWLWYFVVLLVYLEYWRLWYARNLQYEIHTAAINEISNASSKMGI